MNQNSNVDPALSQQHNNTEFVPNENVEMGQFPSFDLSQYDDVDMDQNSRDILTHIAGYEK
jgi:hypothetical protein